MTYDMEMLIKFARQNEFNFELNYTETENSFELTIGGVFPDEIHVYIKRASTLEAIIEYAINDAIKLGAIYDV